MNPSDLKPLLDRLIAEFPGEEVKVSFSQSNERCTRNIDAMVCIGDDCYGWGPDFETALAEARCDFDPRKKERRQAAEALRRKADQIENGEVAI